MREGRMRISYGPVWVKGEGVKDPIFSYCIIKKISQEEFYSDFYSFEFRKPVIALPSCFAPSKETSWSSSLLMPTESTVASGP